MTKTFCEERLHTSICLGWKSERLIKVEETPASDLGKACATSRLRLQGFPSFETNTNILIFLNKLFVNGLFHRFLDHYDKHGL